VSNPTPPGWYPVPGTAQERWWDGTQWTADTRLAQQLAGAPTQAWSNAGLGAPQPQQAGYPDQPKPRRSGLVIGVSAAAIAVVALGIGAAVLLAPEHDDPTPGPTRTVALSGSPAASRSATPSPSPSRSGTSPKPAPSGTAAGTLTDVVHGWRIPMPSGWTRETPGSNITVVEIAGTYDCQMTSPCVRGQFAIETGPVGAADAKAAAEAGMAAYAPRVFGELASHEELTPGATTVAGTRGWAVRWYVTPKQGAKGYVLVVAVPVQGGRFALLHGGVDDDPQAPDPETLDEIVDGIRATSGT